MSGASHETPRVEEKGATPLAARRSTSSAGESPAPDARHRPERKLRGEIVRLLRKRTARAPERARVVIGSDLAVVTLHHGLTQAETSLASRGHADLVVRTREALYDAMQDEATAAVEAITGRRVAAYLARQAHDPDLGVIVFVFDSFPVTAA